MNRNLHHSFMMSLSSFILISLFVFKSACDSPPIWLTSAQIAPYCPTESDCINSLFASMTLNGDYYQYKTTISKIDDTQLQNPVTIEVEIGPESNHSSVLRYEIFHWKNLDNINEEFERGEDCIFSKKYETELCCITPRESFRRYLQREENQYEVYRVNGVTKIHQVQIRITIGTDIWVMVMQFPGQNSYISDTRKEGTNIIKRDVAIGSMIIIESSSLMNLRESTWLLRDIRTLDKSWNDISSWFAIDTVTNKYPLVRLGMDSNVYEMYVQCQSNKNSLIQFHDNISCMNDQFCEARNNKVPQYMSSKVQMNPSSVSLHQSNEMNANTGAKYSYISGYVNRESMIINLIVRGVDFVST